MNQPYSLRLDDDAASPATLIGSMFIHQSTPTTGTAILLLSHAPWIVLHSHDGQSDRQTAFPIYERQPHYGVSPFYALSFFLSSISRLLVMVYERFLPRDH